MIDSIWDTLRFDDSVGMWEAPLSIEMFGRKWDVELIMDGERGSPPRYPTEDQRASLKTFVDNRYHVLSAAENSLLRYYSNVASMFREMFDAASARDLLPVVDSILDLPRVVAPKTVFISEVDPPQTFCVLLDCTWDRSHGVGVRFVGVNVDLVGTQDEML